MKGALEEAFRAHAWATHRLLDFCADLSPDQLAAKGAVTGWTIRGTLTHLVSADSYYVTSLAGSARLVPGWDEDEARSMDIEALQEGAARVAAAWEAYLKTDDDSDGLILIDGGTFECRRGVIVAHALHHGDLHREQVCSIIRSLSLEPPDLQPWEYAIDSSRARFVDAATPG